MIDPTPASAIDRIRAAFGTGEGRHRTLHAKGSFYAGTFTATPRAGELCRALHLSGEAVPALVRWSNGGGDPALPDKAPDVRGMAVKLQLPDGTATDLLGQTAPRFVVRTPEAFIEFVEAAQSPVKLPLFLLKHRDAVGPLIANAKAKAIAAPRSYADPTYYPVHAYRWIAADGSAVWVRYVLRPLASTPPAGTYAGPDRLREEMAARLDAGPVGFTLEVSVASPDDDPHDPMSVWKPVETFDAGTLTITSVAPDPEEGGGVTVFDPTRVVDGIELSEDPILLYRPVAYTESVNRRA
ncbi:MAG TPA: catalase [Nocardioides sp.]|nr:catalase [Nocardioides sp.]